jgi:hypothetical protein
VRAADPTGNITNSYGILSDGHVQIQAAKELRLADSDSSHYVGLKSPATVTTNQIYTLPTEDGDAGAALVTDGSGALSWEITGSGAGEINYIENNNGKSALDQSQTDDVGDWIDSSTGVDSSITSTAADIPRSPLQTTGIKLTFINDSGAEHYTRIRFRVPPADRNKKLKIEWAQLVDSYVASTAKVELYNYSDNYSTGETEVALHGDVSGESYLPNQTGVYYNEFDADSREYYELRIVNAGATAGTITLNDVVVGPGKLHSGAVVTAWKSAPVTVEQLLWPLHSAKERPIVTIGVSAIPWNGRTTYEQRPTVLPVRALTCGLFQTA